MSLSNVRQVQTKEFTPEEFAKLAQFSRREFGICLNEGKVSLVQSRLAKRLEARSINQFSEYLSILNNKNEHDERLELISALTTNVTSFFREKHHFDIVESLCDKLRERALQGERIRIWSAGCSSGQEAYSIAAVLRKKIPEIDTLDIKVLATDIDPKIVERAKQGKYDHDVLASVPTIYKNYFEPAGQKKIQAAQILKNLITFAELNLISNWPFSGRFDVIFCRNVAIYFDQEIQMTLWKKFAHILKDRGILFIGHSERITGDAGNYLTGIGITSYQKCSHENNQAKSRETK